MRRGIDRPSFRDGERDGICILEALLEKTPTTGLGNAHEDRKNVEALIDISGVRERKTKVVCEDDGTALLGCLENFCLKSSNHQPINVRLRRPPWDALPEAGPRTAARRTNLS